MTEELFIEHILKNKINQEILNLLPDINLPDAWLVSGSLFQTVWNQLSGKPPHYGIKDYDIFYFDDSDLSFDAEDEVIKKVQNLFSHLDENIEIRNQARVHLWYPDKFKTPYSALKSTIEGIDRFLAKACQVGIKISKDRPYKVYAPSGFSDLEKMIIRPNRTGNFNVKPYMNKANAWKQKWPELEIIEI